MSDHPPVTTPTGRLLALLRGVKGNGRKFVALCPAHEDANPSLSVSTGADGRCVVHCHAGCTPQAIVAAVGLTLSDLFAGEKKPARQERAPAVARTERMVKSYDYTDENGDLLYQVCRFEPKTFKQRRRNASGQWDYTLGDVRRVLYRLPEVIDAVSRQRRVFLCEGEKDADALAEFNYCATTVAGGASSWRDDFAEVLAGAEVIILPDNDDPGRTYAEQAAASCAKRGCVVKVIALPDLPPKGDVSDWLATGVELDALDEMIGKAPVWSPDPSKRTRWRLDEVWANDDLMRPPPVVVPRLAWSSRSTLLASAEKSGKSTLTGYMSAKVSRGGTFLGDPCPQGVVLIVGLEEFIGDTARRLREFDADATRIHLIPFLVGDPRERPHEVSEHIAAVSPTLVIVDSLIEYGAGVVSDMNNAAQIQPVIQGLTRLAHQTGCAVVVIHHSKKADGRYRDSTAIGGGVDVIAEVLVPDRENDPTLRRAEVRGRVPAQKFDFRYDGTSYSLVVGTDAPIELRLVEYVRDHPNCSANDAADAMGSNRRHALRAITNLIAGGHLRNMGTGGGYKLVVPTSITGNLFASRGEDVKAA